MPKPTSKLLTQLADAVQYLPLILTTRPPLDDPTGNPSPASKPPLSLAVIALEDEILGTLTDWIETCINPKENPKPSPETILGAISWLLDHDNVMQDHPAVDDYQHELTHLVAKTRRAIGEPKPWKPKCTHCHNRVTGYDIHGNETSILEHWTWCACKACGQTYKLAGLQTLGALQKTSIPEYAKTRNIPERTLRRKVKYARLSPCGRHRGNPIYYLDELQKLSI